ncbi:hypothetical protein DSCO28_08010 [Desulfosarcina ovata subsp. sediminis]|uniref:Uncharacterized protein n=1 Tax=Desulfosarcina ovata subsp. sediminis TaxID=885957 RepID=A0A5K7ZJ49_9BACT|nr:hypothetical protein DSCO28_08010 [Desulfosarcina ovata subsp. sediminis]
MKGRFIDRTGQRYGSLTVIKRVPKPTSAKGRAAWWLCRCDCGNETIVRGFGRTKTCGCRLIGDRGITQKFHKEYVVWVGMLNRTRNPDHTNYELYGLEGIKVCSSWRKNPGGFQSFIEDMGPRPYEPDGTPYQLDRVDGDYGYSPWNCRWVTIKENILNRSNVRWLVDPWDGERLCSSEMATKYGLNKGTLNSRISLYGWTLEEALSVPISRRRPTVF